MIISGPYITLSCIPSSDVFHQPSQWAGDFLEAQKAESSEYAIDALGRVEDPR